MIELPLTAKVVPVLLAGYLFVANPLPIAHDFFTATKLPERETIVVSYDDMAFDVIEKVKTPNGISEVSIGISDEEYVPLKDVCVTKPDGEYLQFDFRRTGEVMKPWNDFLKKLTKEEKAVVNYWLKRRSIEPWYTTDELQKIGIPYEKWEKQQKKGGK